MRNSTIIVKKKPCKSCGRIDYHFSKGRCKQCSTVEDFSKRLERESERVIEEEDLGDLITDADTIFSQFVRLKYAAKDGVTGCYTCYTRKHWTLIQAGHYIKRAHLFLRWDERNVKPQCSECNEMKYGNIVEYTKRLDAECKGLPDILRSESMIVHKPTRDEIRQVISEYSQKVKSLKSQLKK